MYYDIVTENTKFQVQSEKIMIWLKAKKNNNYALHGTRTRSLPIRSRVPYHLANRAIKLLIFFAAYYKGHYF